MKITLDMSISKLLDAFDREFGVSLGIYKGAHKSDNIKLFEIADPRKNQKAFIVINKDTSVESAEAMFRNTFGIRVQIKDKNGNTVSQENTLGGIRKLDKGYVDDENKSNINLIDDENAENNESSEDIRVLILEIMSSFFDFDAMISIKVKRPGKAYEIVIIRNGAIDLRI